MFKIPWQWLLKQASQTVKYIMKPPVWGGQGPYKDCRATDDDVTDRIIVLQPSKPKRTTCFNNQQLFIQQ
jgi:hypothetical protein